ncbi:MAG: DUF1549 domain-containing protein, partial [Bryobacterales bacterium]|nr:DUF1549 domain-containing protein [Bryobacterales bacterium]
MLVFSLLAVLPAAAQAGREVSFDKEVKPMLEARCVKCHGPAMQMGKLDLRNREAALKGGEKGPGLLPGNSAQSILFKRVAGLEKPAMPMDGKLTDAEVETLRLWIEQGARWEGEIGTKKPAVDPLKAIEESPLPQNAKEWWSFRKPVRPPTPKVADARWAKHPIDAFVKQQLDAQGLKPAPEADKRTLVRRAYLDLTGLPPTPAEVREFVDDSRPDAWAQLVDRLLASPHYGERWGRHWLDVARYSDDLLNSTQDQPYDNAFRYRDWVIQAFQQDMPVDTFIKAQLAGDQMPDPEKHVAGLGFFALSPQFQDDRVDVTGKAFLGLTVACAQCHDHKFDPIPTRDYYSLLGVFTSTTESEYPLAAKEVVAEYKRRKEAVETQQKKLDKFLEDQAKQLSEVLAHRAADFIRAARRLEAEKADVKAVAAEMKLDEETLTRWRDYLALTSREFLFLRALIQAEGEVVGKKELCNELFGARILTAGDRLNVLVA